MTIAQFAAPWRDHRPRAQTGAGEYAVLVPLVERPEGLCLLYEVRASSLDARQPGEVCFPGGRMEAGEDPVACALRETWEELAIPPEKVEVVARLDFLTHQGGFVMYPVLGVVDPGRADGPQPGGGGGGLSACRWTGCGRTPRRCTPTTWSPRWGRTSPTSASASPRATAGGGEGGGAGVRLAGPPHLGPHRPHHQPPAGAGP